MADVLRSGQLSLGPKLAEFEEAFASYCHTRYGVACSSGTAALHLLVSAMDIGPGDEVITTPFSFIASANCILMTGATPVFVDIDPHTWNLDPTAVAAALSPKTKAVIPVHVFGVPVDMAKLKAMVAPRGIRIIEDACEALGSTDHGAPAGSLGDAGVFGFYPNKQLTTGEGGMIVTDDGKIAAYCRSVRNQGRDSNGGWLAHPRMGYNYRLSDVNCALGLVQLSRMAEILDARAKVAAAYRERLAGDPRIMCQAVPDSADVSWFVFVVRLADQYGQDDRDRMLRALTALGIGCSNYFVPIHLQPFYVERFGFRVGDFPRCEALAQRTIALPFHHELTANDIDTVCSELLRLL